MDLAACREALAITLAGQGYNVSDGGAVTPTGATIGAFDLSYHQTVQGASMGVAVVELAVVVSRADEGSAMSYVDDVLSTLWRVIEQSTGPWKGVIVRHGGLGPELTVGDVTYERAFLTTELYV